jgi:hypothetical protein
VPALTIAAGIIGGMRSLFAVAGWIAAAAAAIGIGLAGVQTIGNGITAGTGGNVLTAEEAARELAAAPSVIPSSTSASPSVASPTPDQPVNVRPFAGTGGTVTAGCLPGGAYLVNWSSAQGYNVKEYRRGPGEYAEVRFGSGSHKGKGNGESRVRIRCMANVPTAEWN